MKRSELVEELDRRGIAVHHNWTVPELRSILLEQKELEKPPKGENPVKGLTKMTLAELSAEATRLEISMPPVPTRGLLMRLIRDVKSTPGQTLVTFGKFKGWMYQEVPLGYLQWSMQEVKANPNSSPDLVRLATWAQGEVERRQKTASSSTEVAKDPEANAVVPPPKMKDLGRHGGYSDASWSRVSGCSSRRGVARRGPEIISDSDLEDEGEDPNLTIKKLEDRISALKKRNPN
jgi:hypothetical protein